MFYQEYTNFLNDVISKGYAEHVCLNIRWNDLMKRYGTFHTMECTADKASRRFKMDHLLTHRRWIDGPEFLWKAEEEWIPRLLLMTPRSNAVIAEDTPSATHQLITYFSDWKRLKRSVAWILKIRKTLLEMGQKRKQMSHEDKYINGNKEEQEMQWITAALGGQSLTPDDLSGAETSIICFTQQESFHDEFAVLSSGKCKVRRISQPTNWTPFWKMDS